MDGKTITIAIGAAAAAFSITSFVPQIIKMIQTKDVSGVSLRTYAFTVSCFTLWVWYGIRVGAWPVTIANAVALAMSAIVLILKLNYGDRHSRSRK